jgi:hypothetical protein
MAMAWWHLQVWALDQHDHVGKCICLLTWQDTRFEFCIYFYKQKT